MKIHPTYVYRHVLHRPQRAYHIPPRRHAILIALSVHPALHVNHDAQGAGDATRLRCADTSATCTTMRTATVQPSNHHRAAEGRSTLPRPDPSYLRGASAERSALEGSSPTRRVLPCGPCTTESAGREVFPRSFREYPDPPWR